MGYRILFGLHWGPPGSRTWLPHSLMSYCVSGCAAPAGAHAVRVLMPIPTTGFDPTETGVPWKYLVSNGYTVVFAVPELPGRALNPKP